VDDVVVIARGRLVHESSLEDLVALADPRVRVVAPDLAAFASMARRSGWAVEEDPVTGSLVVTGASPAEVGAAAYRERLEIHGLAEEGGSLEAVFLRLTAEPDEVAR
jgi:ABC-2 type transport system ATP-binding protein